MDERQPTGSTRARTPTRQLCWVRPVTRRGRVEDPEPLPRRGEPRGPAALRPPDRPGRLVPGAGGRQVARRVGDARCEVAERLLDGFAVVLLRGPLQDRLGQRVLAVDVPQHALEPDLEGVLLPRDV